MTENECLYPSAAISEATADILAFEQYMGYKSPVVDGHGVVTSLTRLVCRWVRAARKLFLENEEAHMSILAVCSDQTRMIADLSDALAKTDSRLERASREFSEDIDALDAAQRRTVRILDTHMQTDRNVDSILTGRLESRDEKVGELDRQINDEVTGLGWHVGVLERAVNDEAIGVLAVQDTQERRLDNLAEWAEGVNRRLEQQDVPPDAEERQIRSNVILDGEITMTHLITNCMEQDLIVNGSGQRFRLVPLHDHAA